MYYQFVPFDVESPASSIGKICMHKHLALSAKASRMHKEKPWANELATKLCERLLVALKHLSQILVCGTCQKRAQVREWSVIDAEKFSGAQLC